MPKTELEPRSISDYRRLYPVIDHKIWLNHASKGTLSLPVVQAIRQHCERMSFADYTIESDILEEATIRSKVAAFVGAAPEEIAFTKNTPDGLNIIANGLAWAEGDSVIIADQEFPANVYPWKNLEKRGVSVRKVESEDGRVIFERIIAAIDKSTRLVSLSWIEFSTGFRNDLKRIAKACHDRDVLFCVDGIQGVGVLPLDVHETEIDFMATSSHKWLLAPDGVGWLYVRKNRLEDVGVTFLGQSSVQRGASLDYLNFSLPLWSDARRFEPGIQNRMGMVGLAAAIDLFNEVGMESVTAQIKSLTDRAVAGLMDRGYRVLSSRQGEEWSGAVSFTSPTQSAEEIYKALLKHNIVTSLRAPVVRVSPHYYNNIGDIDAFIDALP